MMLFDVGCLVVIVFDVVVDIVSMILSLNSIFCMMLVFFVVVVVVVNCFVLFCMVFFFYCVIRKIGGVMCWLCCLCVGNYCRESGLDNIWDKF